MKKVFVAGLVVLSIFLFAGFVGSQPAHAGYYWSGEEGPVPPPPPPRP